MKFITESSALGRVVVLHGDGAPALFYTTADFSGFLDDRTAGEVNGFVRDRFGIDAPLATCGQVHGVEIVRAGRNGEPWCESQGCDALWSAASPVALGIKVADCLPVTIHDPANHVAANVHAGWRGSAKNIISKTLETLRAQSSFDPSKATAALGPSIRVCCFEVGEEVVDQFLNTFDDFDRFVDRSRGPKPHLDLAELAKKVLKDSGLDSGKIIDSEICTRCNGSIFHSFRRDGKASGRNLAIIAQ